MQLSPGRRLGPYEIVEPLGAGGMGEVYRARDPRLGRDVALKVLPAAMADNPDALERFTREARAVAALNHPGIVTIHSTEEADGIRFLTMELVEGRTLDRVIPEGGVSLAQFFDVAIAIADALTAAHQKQITHRDLKPANVMLADDGRVKVLDFGLARAADVAVAGAGDEATRAALTGAGTILGTVAYMSPEQIEGRPVDARSDVFSFGVLAYELLTGARPFRGDSSPAVMAAVMRDRPKLVSDLRPDVPAGVSSLIERCLEKNARDRVPSAHVLAELKALRAARESGTAPVVAAPRRRPRTMIAVAAVAVLALAGVSAWFAFPWRKSPAAPASKPAVAVLPFEDLSEKKDQAYFADGVSEDILNVLSRIPELRVTSRSSAFALGNQRVATADIGQRLHVDHLLEGTIRRSGNDVRITANLIDVKTDTPVWSETFDRHLDDVVTVQDEIAYAVARKLRHTLTAPDVRPRKVDGRAYDLYLQAMDVSRQARPDRYEQVQRILSEALSIDQSFAQGWAAIAVSYNNEASNGDARHRPTEDTYRLARQAAERAVSLDPKYPWGYTALATIAVAHDNDLQKGARYLEQALALDPDGTNLLLPAATLLADLGRNSEAIAIREYTLASDPLSPFMQFNLGIAYLNGRRYDEAIAALKRSLAMAPKRTVAHFEVGVALLLKHDAAGALAEFQLEPADGWKAIGLPLALHALGRTKEADEALATLVAKYEAGSSYNVAQVYAMQGQRDKAFTWLEKAVGYHDGGLTTILVDPLVDSLHDDPRWVPFLRTIGRAPEQVDAVQFHVTVPAP